MQVCNRPWLARAICSLCHTRPETNEHMLVTCAFSKQVWAELQQRRMQIIVASEHGGRQQLDPTRRWLHTKRRRLWYTFPGTFGKKDLGSCSTKESPLWTRTHMDGNCKWSLFLQSTFYNERSHSAKKIKDSRRTTIYFKKNRQGNNT